MNLPFHANDTAEQSNPSHAPPFRSLLGAAMSRRRMLSGGASLTAAWVLGSLPLSGCQHRAEEPLSQLSLPFKPAPHCKDDRVSIADEAYQVSVLIPVGTPLREDLADWQDETSADADSFAHRVGDNHDGMVFFGLHAQRHAPTASARGLLVLNHEYVESWMLHPHGMVTEEVANPHGWFKLQRQAEDVRREINAHGISVAEVERTADGSFRLVTASRFNRRITAASPARFSGPAAGSPLLQTRFDPTGQRTRGTLNNCGSNRSPWGTYLSCEENFNFYFARGESDRLSAEEKIALDRYGVKVGWVGLAGSGNGRVEHIDWQKARSNNLWFTADNNQQKITDEFRRWDLTASADNAQQDYRNEMNGFGYVVEFDPFDPDCVPVKRTALGRFAHETCSYAPVTAGQPVVFYMGDDAKGEYIYKFVSAQPWDPADADRGMSAGDKYLNEGRLYAAKFSAGGDGEWLELSLQNPRIAQAKNYTFAQQADICVMTRLAADAAGATPMDRPEWTSVNPRTGEAYFSLTNNAGAEQDTSKKYRGGAWPVDAANPRQYASPQANSNQTGNINGHIIRLKEDKGTHFKWDVYLFGAQANHEQNWSGLTAENDFSSPDGLGFDPRGLLWIQTDDSSYTDVTNCMMLVALPGKVGDGTLLNNSNTPIGAQPQPHTLARFLTGPVGCEITGIAFTPDLRTLFINIQHPGEGSQRGHCRSHWPASQEDETAKALPRSATVVISRKDGGVIAG